MTRNKSAESQKFSVMVGSNLKFLRLNRKVFMPQKVPAAFIGVTHQQMNKYETGKNIPCAYRLAQLAKFYKVSTEDLINPSYIYQSTKDNEILDKGLTPQDPGYLKPQPDVGSLEELKEAADGNL